ncbi:MAG: nucleotidyltransferase [Actinomycetia bacterium]|nr:nucleotidyltransferase [Actinomycetes bacterium]
MSLEDTLSGWTGPSSNTEQDKQDRTERMICEAVEAHAAFKDCSLSVFAKGSYPNNTNVRADSDVDIAVQCHEVIYWDEHEPGAHPPSTSYTGIWTPEKLRSELLTALRAKFPGQVDASGKVALHVNSGSSRVDADVVPCFDYRYYFSPTYYRKGTRIVSTAGKRFENYPVQHLENGRTKNTQTYLRFKKVVRILKRLENVMELEGAHREVPSFLVESLVYNCPAPLICRSTWTDTVKGVLAHVYHELQGEGEAWLEVNECKYLFGPGQKWAQKDGMDFAFAAWNYLGFGK